MLLRIKKSMLPLCKRLLSLKRNLMQGRATVSVNILQFLSKWLQTHIKGTDQKYSSFLNEKGIK